MRPLIAFTALAVLVLMLASCHGSPKRSDANLSECCVQTQQLLEEVSACCSDVLAGKKDLADCCPAGPDGGVKACCMASHAAIEKIAACCRKTMAGDRQPCCAAMEVPE